MHVDAYVLGAFDPPGPGRFHRRYEKGDLPYWYFDTDESHWNGYVWYTIPHEDDECKTYIPVKEN